VFPTRWVLYWAHLRLLVLLVNCMFCVSFTDVFAQKRDIERCS